MEVHFVHKHPTLDKLAVVSVQFDVGDGGNQKNEFIDALHAEYKNITNLTIPSMKLLGGLNYEKLYYY